MNLVAKEYVASQNPDDPGVLILSRFAGAAQECKAALLVNPYDPDSVAAAIGQALSMPLAERRERHDALFQVLSHNNIQHWADRFLAALERQPTALSQLEQMPSADRNIVVSSAFFLQISSIAAATSLRTPFGIFGVGYGVPHYAPVVEEAWFDARPRQPSGEDPNHGSDGNGNYGAKLVR